MPYSGLNQYSQFHQRLLHDLALALNITMDQVEPWREFILDGRIRGIVRILNQDDCGGKAAVATYLEYQFASKARQCILILGRSAARFVLGDHRPFDQLRGAST